MINAAKNTGHDLCMEKEVKTCFRQDVAFTWSRCDKAFFMFSSAETEILIPHKY